MNSKRFFNTPGLTGFTASLLSVAISGAVQAQEEAPPPAAPPVMEELLVTGGRLISGAEQLSIERQDRAVATDFIGSEQIGRIGDSTVAVALTRVPGVTLIENKFVFVRGLGERYSNTLLNDAAIPSPDLTRSVIPLDIFPTSIVDSLAVQKVPSANKPAAFGGGSVNIRTRGIPDQFVFSVEVGSGFNSQTESVNKYTGGDDDSLGKDDGTRALPGEISQAINQFRGDLTSGSIRNTLDIDNAEAQQINRSLATEFNRNLTLREDGSPDPDMDFDITLGNVFSLPKGMEFGFLASVSYSNEWRQVDVRERRANDAQQRTFEDETTQSVDLTGNFNAGLRLNPENTITVGRMFLRNTDDEVSVRDNFNANFRLEDGRGFRDTQFRYEERLLKVDQIKGEHELGWDTFDLLGLSERFEFLRGTTFNWYFSDSEASTDLPNEVEISENITVDPQTLEVLSRRTAAGGRDIAEQKFSDLRDDLDSSGWSLAVPFELANWSVELSGGADYWQKSRRFQELVFSLRRSGATALEGDGDGDIGAALSDENILDPANGFILDNDTNNVSSNIAAQKVNAAFGQLDVTWDQTLRLVVGTRWEDYQQLNLPWNPIKFDGSQIPGIDNLDSEALADFFRDATFAEDDFFASAAFTWMVKDFWAEDFQLRASFGESVVRPDLREISVASFFDPLTDISVTGNPDLVPSAIDNFDLRAEWFFSGGDNLTVSAFYKDISDPIEQFERAATDDNIAAEIVNADQAEVYGVELEFLKRLGSFSPALDSLFVQGNFTLMNQELIVGDRADSPTNNKRDIQGASDTVANVILGFDSPNTKHAATLSYNVFSERLFTAGRNGVQDSFEQPFNSLNATYSYFPTDNFSIKFKVQNLLDESLEVDKPTAEGDVTIIERERGQDFSLSVKYQF